MKIILKIFFVGNDNIDAKYRAHTRPYGLWRKRVGTSYKIDVGKTCSRRRTYNRTEIAAVAYAVKNDCVSARRDATGFFDYGKYSAGSNRIGHRLHNL